MTITVEPFAHAPDLYHRAGTHDIHIFAQIWRQDEYHIRDRFFSGDDLIFDFGAHAGYFSRLVLERGAGLVVAFEPHHDNYDLARKNLDKFIKQGRCILVRDALGRSDRTDTQWLYYEWFEGWNEGANTGGISLETSPIFEISNCIKAYGLDTFLDRYGIPRLIKLDCEGAEWPGLMTSHRLAELPEILGEYHEVGGDYDHHDGRAYNLPYDNMTVHNLEHHLRNEGGFTRFEGIRRHYEHYNPVLKKHFSLSWLGNFWAWRE